MSYERQPRRPLGPSVVWPAVTGEHATHDIFVDIDTEGMRDLLGDAEVAELRIAPFHRYDRRDELRGRTFRTWFAALPRTSALWNLKKVVGLRIADSFGIRCGATNKLINPMTNRSVVVRSGPRRLERAAISS